MLRAAGLDKSYGDVHALRGVDLSVDAGEVIALLGRNGAGLAAARFRVDETKQFFA